MTTTPQPNHHWYHLTPDRFFLGLLVVQVFLLLSERFQWFPFNENKGWTVLIALGVVCVAFVVMLLWGLVCLCLRRRFQFSFRSLLLFVVAVSVSLGWFAWEMQRARRQREAVEAMLELGGEVVYEHGLMQRPWVPPREPDTPAWLRIFLGDDLFFNVWAVTLSASPITDDEMEHLSVLTNLNRLNLGDTEVSDAGLHHVSTLTSLEQLSLDGTHATDEGLLHLAALNNLTYLGLARTSVTDEGVQKLQQALPNCTIER